MIKEVDPNLLLSLIQMNLVQLDIILYQALLGPGPGIGLEDILGKRNLIAIGLILEIPIDGNTKDVLGLVHIMTGDLDIVRLEAGSYHTHVISVTVLVGLPIFKKRGDGFLALLLLIRMLFQTSYQGLLQIMSERESVASPIQKSVTTSSHRVKDKSSTHRLSESCSVYSEEEDDGKISYAETIEEVFNLLPTSICPRKNDPSIPSKPRSGIDLLNPTEDKESSSLPQSQLIKDILNLVQTYVSDKVKLEPGWTAPVNLERELGTHMKFYKLHNEQFPSSIPEVDKDASKLDLSTTGSINVSSKFLESMECQARNVISINSYLLLPLLVQCNLMTWTLICSVDWYRHWSIVSNTLLIYRFLWQWNLC